LVDFWHPTISETDEVAIVENVVGMLQVIVENCPGLKEAAVAFSRYSYPKDKTFSARLAILKHERVRRWSEKVRFLTGGWQLMERVNYG